MADRNAGKAFCKKNFQAGEDSGVAASARVPHVASPLKVRILLPARKVDDVTYHCEECGAAILCR